MAAPLITGATLLGCVTVHGNFRSILLMMLPLVGFLSASALRRGWPYQRRALSLIAPLVLATFITYGIVGFRGNGNIIAASAVVLAGLFFGRRGAIATAGVVVVAPILACAGTLSGVLPIANGPDIAVDSPTPWIRTTSVALAVWTVLGVTVTFVVQRIEQALHDANQTLAKLRAEQQLRERAEEERLHAQDAALQAQKMELVARLAAGAAHDFNNLLAVVGNWAELLLLDAGDRPENQEARDAVDTALQQGRALTRQLMALARQDQRTVRKLQLEKCAKSGVTTLSRVLPAGVTLRFRETSPVQVEADETELQQVLFNLVLNARDAMPNGGSIQVLTGVETLAEPQPVVGGTLPSGRWAVMRVADSGPGIPAELRERIFELFFTTKPVGEGTGLGLATVLRIAQKSGGGVALDSEPGSGSRFSIYLPCAS
ncbi:MAG TPA: ATP-binding protein [Polyangiaceae bacterium]|nr:ATP-binding protein [Polyangiaceae bacterium]